ncbi:Molybdenum cofactor biosynthesis protein MoaA [Hyphomicrobium sulfonivorans]|uniref:Molybdenum cofactor biosynthesis protein MoaA n=2 Tax=Hyphomicrobium sulfonivorans TaxID=121290 RepID=A0A109BQ87_HYPSL|nr:Molybdenum cofactor biosynthesis protein MoaA [Hyphomicrobium sulfonivorans]
MRFLPSADLLTLDELVRLCAAFIARGIRKIRISGGEPLVRRNILDLFRALSHDLSERRIDEVTLTTNGTHLLKHARDLSSFGVRRINMSLDSLSDDRFRTITRGGDLATVLRGWDAAQSAGLAVKINTVALKGVNEDEIERLIVFAHSRGADISLIETMPLGDVGIDRTDQYLPLSLVRANLMRSFTLDSTEYSSGGPARYVVVRETGGKLGFITPLTHNFCENCNRVRVTCTGTLYSCLGQNNAVDLRSPLRASSDDDLVHQAIDAAIMDKPQGHDFIIDRNVKKVAIARHMSTTGG